MEREQLNSFLFEELKSGNSRAFDRIFNDNYLNLCRLANAVVHDEDAANSLVQNVFVKLWESRESLGHVDRLVPYLTSMVRNSSINYLQREKRNLHLDRIPEESSTCNSTEDQIAASEFEEQLLIALAALPERCRMAFEYSRFENYSNKEIAEKMNISVKGVEALIGRALKSLRVALSDYLNSPKHRRIPQIILFAIFRIRQAIASAHFHPAPVME